MDHTSPLPLQRQRRVAGAAAFACACVMAGAVSSVSWAGEHRISDGYMKHDELVERLEGLASSHEACRLIEIGESIEGRSIHAMILSTDPERAESRPGLLITAGLDGRHWVGTETAVRVAESILEMHADLLDSVTLYVIPRANPDGAERNLGPVNYGHIGNLRPVDLDRDGELNEDGPNDLLGNGVITKMRRLSPPLDDPPTHLPDPNEPRLLKEPDRAEGQTAIFSLYTEGIDEDDDGLIAEDGPGGVDLDRNFPHLYPEHARDAGRHQISEPETRALAEFVVERRNIVLAVTYGRHDNMIHTPDHRRMDVTGRTPIGIMEGDLALYQGLSKLYKETTGQKRAAEEDHAGSFHAWLYAHRGLPSIAVTTWGRPDIEQDTPPAREDDDPPTTDDAHDESDASPLHGHWAGTINLQPLRELGMADMPEELDVTMDLSVDNEHGVDGTLTSELGTLDLAGRFDPETSIAQLTGAGAGMQLDLTLRVENGSISGTAQAMGIDLNVAARRAADPADAPGDGPRQRSRNGRVSDPEAAVWLTYSDSRDGVGFVEWQAFDHPQLGQVEIGGFVPGFKMNPSADELDDLAAGHADFIVELIERRPDLRVEGPEIRRLGPGLFEVRVSVINDGWFPSMTAMGRRARVNLPVVLRLSAELDDIVSGNRVERLWGVDGRGGRRDLHWILQESEGTTIEIEMIEHNVRTLLLSFPLTEDASLAVQVKEENQ